MTDDSLTAGQVAALLGILPATWRSYVSRGQAPKPNGYHDARTPYWFRSTIETWNDVRSHKRKRPGTA